MIEGDAVAKIAQLAQEAQEAGGKIARVGEEEYSTVPLHHVKPLEPEPRAVAVHTLTAIRGYLKKNPDQLKLEDLIIHVESPEAVRLQSRLVGRYLQRPTYMTASPSIPQGFPFGQYLPTEDFQIAVQAGFRDAGDRERVFKEVAEIKDTHVRTDRNDGVTQRVTVKAGVERVEEHKIVNPVLLTPFRTFPEIDQPESPFIFRLKGGDAGIRATLIEADGGAWKLTAIERIATWLQEETRHELVIA